MKSLLILTLLFSIQLKAEDFVSRNLDHLDRIEIGRDLQAEGVYTVQYPGIGTGRFDQTDCLILRFGNLYPTNEQLERLKKQVIVTDGSGNLFPDGHRYVNVLEPKKIKLGPNGQKTGLAYFLKDLGTYVTGVNIKPYSPFLSVSQILSHIFGERSEQIEFIFLRGCEL